jgi:hypothetical protein
MSIKNRPRFQFSKYPNQTQFFWNVTKFLLLKIIEVSILFLFFVESEKKISFWTDSGTEWNLLECNFSDEIFVEANRILGKLINRIFWNIIWNCLLLNDIFSNIMKLFFIYKFLLTFQQTPKNFYIPKKFPILRFQKIIFFLTLNIK